MKELYIVRHGQTFLNSLNRTQGWVDSPLTELGREQARQMGQVLGASKLTFDAIFSSDRGRALETASLICQEANLPYSELIQLPAWREMCFGQWEGVSNPETIQAILTYHGFSSTEEAYQSRRQFRDLITETVSKVDESGWGESGEVFRSRLQTALDQVIKHLEEKGGQRALIIAHGVVMETLFNLLEPTADLPEIDNGRAMILTYQDGQFQVKKVNVEQF